MESVMYIKTDDVFDIVQAIAGSADSDTVNVTVMRLSDEYYWNFTDEEFTSTADTGTMTYVTGELWTQSFTPPTDDTYIVTITDVTLGTSFTQVLKALGDTDSFTFRTNSEVSICNLALTQLGANTIISLSDDSEVARKCAAVYTRVRDEMLSSHPWNFAVKRDTLAVLDETPKYGYTYAYQLPTDCLRVLETEDDWEYQVEDGKLLTDASGCTIRYIFRNEDPSDYSPGFVTAFAAAIAKALAFAITESRTISADAAQMAQTALANAKSKDGQEGTPPKMKCSEWLDAR